MKYLPATALIVCMSILSLSAHSPYAIHPLNGAWKITSGTTEYLLLVSGGYCMRSSFDKTNKQFITTDGGPLTIDKNKAVLTIHFNSSDKNEVGKTEEFNYSINGHSLTISSGRKSQTWQRADDGKSILAGNWRITKRKNGEQLSEIPLRPRRTLKLLTGNYFQWAAINIDTGEFSGTGGGKYTFENGQYTEQIEFFSRDNSRVGTSLRFDGKVENDDWIHSGLSSKGDPVYEIWSRFK